MSFISSHTPTDCLSWPAYSYRATHMVATVVGDPLLQYSNPKGQAVDHALGMQVVEPRKLARPE